MRWSFLRRLTGTDEVGLRHIREGFRFTFIAVVVVGGFIVLTLGAQCLSAIFDGEQCRFRLVVIESADPTAD